MNRNKWLYKYGISNFWMFSKFKNKTESKKEFFKQYKKPHNAEAVEKKYPRRVIILDTTKDFKLQLKNSKLKKKYKKEILRYYGINYE